MNAISLIKLCAVMSFLGLGFFLGNFTGDASHALITPPPAPTAVPTPRATKTPLPLYGGEWSDDFIYFTPLSTMNSVDVRNSQLILKFSEILDWTQTWDAHFAMGEFWQTRAISDSVQLAPNGSNQYFTTGMYTSTVFDAARPVDWMSTSWRISGTPISVTLQFRTGNTNPIDESWSAWIAPQHIVFGDLLCAITLDSDLSTDCTSTMPGIQSSRYLQYRLLFNSNDPNNTLAFYDIRISYGIHTATGSAISLPISPIDLEGWKEVFYTSTVPISTALTIDVLAQDGTVLMPNVTSSASLESIDSSLYPSIQLRATLQTNEVSRSPELDLWGVQWIVGRKLYLPVIAR